MYFDPILTLIAAIKDIIKPKSTHKREKKKRKSNRTLIIQLQLDLWIKTVGIAIGKHLSPSYKLLYADLADVNGKNRFSRGKTGARRKDLLFRKVWRTIDKSFCL